MKLALTSKSEIRNKSVLFSRREPQIRISKCSKQFSLGTSAHFSLFSPPTADFGHSILFRTRLPSPSPAYSLNAGIHGNGGQVSIFGFRILFFARKSTNVRINGLKDLSSEGSIEGTVIYPRSEETSTGKHAEALRITSFSRALSSVLSYESVCATCCILSESLR